MIGRVARWAKLERDGRARFVALEDGRAFVLDAPPWLGGSRTGEVIEGAGEDGITEGYARLSPVAPSKILCVGRNYKAHAKELGNEVPAEPLLFFKPPSSLLAPNGVIELPPPSISARVDHEAELAVVIGAQLKRASIDEAKAAIFGLTLAGDITARVSMLYRSAWYSTVLNDAAGKTGDFALVDGSLGWESADGRFRAMIWGKNLTNHTWVSALTPTAQFFIQRFYGPPRTFGMTVGAKF